MQKAIILGAGALAFLALPALADGYENVPKPNKGPAPLSPQTSQPYQKHHGHGWQDGRKHHDGWHKKRHHGHHGDRDVRVVKVIREGGCWSACQPVHHYRTYVTEPVITARYTRTYTRIAPPDCYHTSYSSSCCNHAYGSGYHSETRYRDYGSTYSRSGDWGSYRGSSYREPVYDENTVIWSSSGQRGPVSGYDGYYRGDGYSYYQPLHDDRTRAWAHYDHGWKSKTNIR